MPPKKKQRTAAQKAEEEAKAGDAAAASKGSADGKATAANGAASVHAANGNSAAEVLEGAVLRCTELACLFNAIEDEDYEREVNPGQTLVVAGPSRNCGDYTMVPVHKPNSTDGAVQYVQLDLFEVVTEAGKQAETAAASSSQSATEPAGTDEKMEEAEKQRQAEVDEKRRKDEEEVEAKRRQDQEEYKRREDEAAEQKRQEEEAKEKRRQEEDESKPRQEEEESIRHEKDVEARRREEEAGTSRQDGDEQKKAEAETENLMQDADYGSAEQEDEALSWSFLQADKEVGPEAAGESAEELKRKREETEAAAAAAAQTSDGAPSSGAAPGKRVRLHSLVSAADLNGQLGILTVLNEQNGRWEVKLIENPDRKVQIKTDKFVILPDQAERDRSRSRDRVPAGDAAGEAFDPEASPAQAGAAAEGASASSSGAAPEVCSACGSGLSPDALFCRKCGTKCASRAPPPEAAQSPDRPSESDAPPGDNRPPPPGPPPPGPPPLEQISDNHYEALCLTVRATDSEIKKAYHVQSRKHHPDKNPGDENATKRFQRIMEAYNVLSDRAKRSEYDGSVILKEVLGEQRYDQRTHQWVVRNRAAGRDVQSMRLDPMSAQRLLQANHQHNGMYFRQVMQATGCDILVLDRMVPCVILLGVLQTSPQDGQKAKALFEATLAELDGSKAPRDGVVMIVPQDATTYMRMQQASMIFTHLYSHLRVHCRVAAANRIVLQGSQGVPQAVVQIQSPVGWCATILLPNGQQLDSWTWAHHTESSGGAIPARGCSPGDQFKYLCPPQDPTDPPLVRRILCWGLGLNEEDSKEETLCELAIRVLEGHAKGRRITCAMMRACTSMPVHAEFSALQSEARLPLLFALIEIIPVAGAAIAERFTRIPEYRSLQVLLDMFRHSSDTITLRIRCWNELRQVVPEDGEWHSWEEVLKSDGPLLNFWKDLARWMDDERHPPIEWLEVLKIMYPILSVCVPRPEVECDRQQGLRRPKAEEGAEEAEKERQSKAKEDVLAILRQDSPKQSHEDNEEAEKLTLLEHIEELVSTLASTGNASWSPKTCWVQMNVVVEEAKTLEIEGEENVAEKISTEWFDSHKASFECSKFQQKLDVWEWKVRLVQAAHVRASSRLYERRCGPRRVEELLIAEEVFPKVCADKESLPRALRPFELAALLCTLAKKPQVVSSGQFPMDSLLRRISRMHAKDILHQFYPFSPAMLMRAIVALAKKKQSWNKEALDVLLQAAALNMHTVDKRIGDNPVDRPPATLEQTATSLWAAAQPPFSERLNEHLRRGEHTKTPIVQSAALRLQIEVAQQASMSTEGSAFRNFAQMCAWLAHVTVISSLSSEMRNDVMGAFKRLGEVCENLGKQPETAPCDPEGLCRLAMAVALVGREEQGRKQEKEAIASTKRALEGLACVIIDKAMDEAFDWTPQQLAVLASAYSAAEVPHEGLFAKIGETAERHAMLGNEWSTDQLMKLLNSAQELGQLKTMEGLLNNLDVHQYVQEATPKNMPLLVNVCLSIDNMEMLQELMEVKKAVIFQIPLQGLLTMLKIWPAKNENTPSLTSVRQQLVRECVVIAGKRACSREDLQSIVEAIKEDPKAKERMTELAASPALLASASSLESSSWSDMQKGIKSILSPFVQFPVDAPRLEAACAARLLQALEKDSANSRIDSRDFAPAVLEFPENALVGMPVVVETVADRLRAKLPKGSAASNSSYSSVRELLHRLTGVVLKYARRNSGDNELDQWVERFERTVLDDTRSLRLDSVEHLCGKRMPGITASSDKWNLCTTRVPGSLREALGNAWVTILLVRSRKLAWNGGRSLQAEPPQPRSAVKKLADAGAHFDKTLRERLIGLESEQAASRGPTRAPNALDRSRSRGRNKWDVGPPAGKGGGPVGAARGAQIPPPMERQSQQYPNAPPSSGVTASQLHADRRPLYGSALAREAVRPTAGAPSTSRPSHVPEPPAGNPYNRYGTPAQPSSREQPARSVGPSSFPRHPNADLVVEGCRDKAMAETLQGGYKKWGMNQQRPVFQRVREPDSNEQLVLLYYWDDRDGPDQMGWWFGPEVGGEEVWAHHGGSCATGRDVAPPERGWRMLHNQTEDPDMRVISQSRSHPPSVAPTAKGGAIGVAPRRVPYGSAGSVGPTNAGGPRPAPRGSAGYNAQGTPQPGGAARPPPSTYQQQATPPQRPGMVSQQARPGTAGNRGVWGATPQAPARAPPQAPAQASRGGGTDQQQRQSALHSWLKRLDQGQGQLLQYYDVLAREFDADLTMIAAVKVEGGERRGGLIGCVDPSFWDTVKVTKMGHRMLFAKGISQL